MAVSALYRDCENEPGAVDDRRPLRALLTAVKAGGPPFSVRDSGAFTWQPPTARNDQSTAPAASAISGHLSCSRPKTPTRFHSRKRRSAVAVEQRDVTLSAR